MDWIHATILGLIQGITEFLPISSSGHLILLPHLFKWQDQGLIFDVATNTGSLLAVLVFFRKDIVRLTTGFFRSVRPRGLSANPDGVLAWAIVLGTVPVGLAGLAFQHQIATLARNPIVIATTSILFGLLLGWADKKGTRNRKLADVNWKDALVIGLYQALALIPGTSRAGITMTAGLFSGFNREASARFSFLLAIPVGILAGSLEFLDVLRLQPTPNEWMLMGLGVAVSALSAFAVIHWLLDWVKRQTLTVFVIYRMILGIVIFALVL